MDDFQQKTKVIIFWGMLLVGVLWLLSVFVRVIQDNTFSLLDTVVSVILIGMAFGYKYQQKI
ncbi:hypothetical protein ACFL0W_05075 [Nanoarchaeota archaeon]